MNLSSNWNSLRSVSSRTIDTPRAAKISMTFDLKFWMTSSSNGEGALHFSQFELHEKLVRSNPRRDLSMAICYRKPCRATCFREGEAISLVMPAIGHRRIASSCTLNRSSSACPSSTRTLPVERLRPQTTWRRSPALHRDKPWSPSCLQWRTTNTVPVEGIGVHGSVLFHDDGVACLPQLAAAQSLAPASVQRVSRSSVLRSAELRDLGLCSRRCCVAGLSEKTHGRCSCRLS